MKFHQLLKLCPLWEHNSVLNPAFTALFCLLYFLQYALLCSLACDEVITDHLFFRKSLDLNLSDVFSQRLVYTSFQGRPTS